MNIPHGNYWCVLNIPKGTYMVTGYTTAGAWLSGNTNTSDIRYTAINQRAGFSKILSFTSDVTLSFYNLSGSQITISGADCLIAFKLSDQNVIGSNG